MNQANLRSGFVAVVGKPNVGKSTLVNYLVGRSVSIASSKPETTRRRILGVVHGEGHQMVLVDTPGLAPIRHALGQRLHDVAAGETVEADVIIFMVELTHFPKDEDLAVAKLLEHSKAPIFLVGNKTDRAQTKENLLPLLDAYGKLGTFAEVYPVSAQSGDNMEALRAALIERLPEGVAYFPPEMTSDMDEVSRVEDLIRLQVLENCRQEVPHAVAIKVEEMKPGDDNPDITLIRAIVYVERPTQKKIIIGKKGEMLKRIGQVARENIQVELGRPVFLDLWVKVKEDWRQRPDWIEVLF